MVENEQRRGRRYRASRRCPHTYRRFLNHHLSISRHQQGRKRETTRRAAAEQWGQEGTEQEASQDSGKRRNWPWRRKKEREGEAPLSPLPKVAGKREEKSAKKRQRERGIDGRERAEVRAWTERKRERSSLLRPASKMALAAAPSSLKSIIKKYIRGHLRFSSVS